MYLIRWRDDAPDSWVPEEFVSDEVRRHPLPVAPAALGPLHMCGICMCGSSLAHAAPPRRPVPAAAHVRARGRDAMSDARPRRAALSLCRRAAHLAAATAAQVVPWYGVCWWGPSGGSSAPAGAPHACSLHGVACGRRACAQRDGGECYRSATRRRCIGVGVTCPVGAAAVTLTQCTPQGSASSAADARAFRGCARRDEGV